MNFLFKITFFLTGLTILTACGEQPVSNNTSTEQNTNYQPNKDEIAFEEKMLSIDEDKTLRKGNSLFYSKGDGTSVDVEIFVDSTNQVVKMIEHYTTSATSSLYSNTFYLVDGKKFSSIERLETGEGDQLVFSERASYYDKNEKPILSKIRSATYEEELGLEQFKIIDKYDCSMKRAIAVLNQTDEYVTTFRGFVSEDPYLYIIVGEDDVNGYSSSLVVQMMTSTIKRLQMNEKEMIGKPLTVDFETLDDNQGFVYQILTSVEIR